jgi:hypothetical protein
MSGRHHRQTRNGSRARRLTMIATFTTHQAAEQFAQAIEADGGEIQMVTQCLNCTDWVVIYW